MKYLKRFNVFESLTSEITDSSRFPINLFFLEEDGNQIHITLELKEGALGKLNKVHMKLKDITINSGSDTDKIENAVDFILNQSPQKLSLSRMKYSHNSGGENKDTEYIPGQEMNINFTEFPKVITVKSGSSSPVGTTYNYFQLKKENPGYSVISYNKKSDSTQGTEQIFENIEKCFKYMKK